MKLRCALAFVVVAVIAWAWTPGAAAVDGGVGTGTSDGGLVVQPITLDLGTIDLGGGGGSGGSGTFDLVNTNVSAVPIRVDGYNRPSTSDCVHFSINTGTPLPQFIAPGNRVTWSAMFNPAGVAPGDYSCTVDILDDDGNPDFVVLVVHVIGPNMVVSPLTVPFGNVMVGTPSMQFFSIQNSGTSTLVINNVVRMGSAYFVDDMSPPPFSIPPQTAQQVMVTFTPLSTGPVSATRQLDSNDPAHPMATVTFTGAGVSTSTGAHITLSPNPLGFGSTPVGTPLDRTLTVGNDGTSVANVTSLDITGPDASQFTIETFCTGVQSCAMPFPISPSSSQPITVRCDPTSSGTKSASLAVTSNATNSPTSVSLSCTGSAAQIQVQPSSLSFGTVRIGTPSASQNLTIRNTGNSVLTYTLATSGASGDYGISPPCATQCTLGPGTQTQHAITFTPGAYGPRNATLTVTSNDPSNGSVTVDLSGVGGSGVLTLVDPSSGSMSFGGIPINTTSTSQPVQLRNDGNLSLTVSQLAITQGSVYAINGTVPPPSLVLGPGVSATVGVTCTPTQAIDYPGQIAITTDAVSMGSRTISLDCSGVATDLVAMPAPVAFPATRIGSSAVVHVTVKNVGTGNVDVTGITPAPGVFTIENAPALPTSLGANASFGVDVRFTPTADGDVDGTLTIANSGNPLVVQLHGPGRSASFSVMPTGHDFGTVCVGQSATVRVVVTSTGSADIQLQAPTLDDPSHAFGVSMIDPLAGAYPATLAPTDTATFDVIATPGAGSASGQVHVVTDVSPNGSVDLPLAVTAIASGIAMGPDPVDFGNVALDTTSPGQTVTLANCTTDAISISAVHITGSDADAFDVGGTLPPPDLMLAANATASWTVVFHPVRTGSHSAALTVTTASGMQSVALTGVGGTAGPDAGAGGDGGNGFDTTSYYACACRTGAPIGGGVPVVFVVVYLVVPRRRRRA